MSFGGFSVEDGEKAINFPIDSPVTENLEDATAFYNYEEYKTGVTELLTFGKDRTKSVQAQLNGGQSAIEYGNIVTTINLSALGQQNTLIYYLVPIIGLIMFVISKICIIKYKRKRY